MSIITRTDRLLLLPLDVTHTEEAFKVYGDPRIWEHRPQARHESARETLALIDHAQQCWAQYVLGPWAVYLRDQPTEFIGVGGLEGVANRVWDLKFRLRPEKWGHGYATEVAERALLEASRCETSLPVSARVTVNHPVSIRVLEKLGLHAVWEGRRVRTEDDPSEPLVRIYSNEDLDETTLSILQARP